MEYAKVVVDCLNAWHCRTPDWFVLDDFARAGASLHFWLRARRARGA
jgi:hypothetical protein